MFQLINTGQQSERNAVNVPIFWEMTNADMAKAIEQEILLNEDDFYMWSVKQREDVETFLETLKSASDGLFIDPCIETCPDAFICSFGFKEE